VTVRNRTRRVGGRLLTRPAKPPKTARTIPSQALVIGLDGGYGKSRQPFERHFEITAGKLLGEDGECTRFAFATNEYERGVCQIRQGMEERGVNAETQITVLSDGDAGLRTVQREVAPESAHILDWFPIGMRFEHLLDASKAMHHVPMATHVAAWAHQVATRAKWAMWNGQVRQNPQTLGGTIPLDEIRARGGVGSAPAATGHQRPAGLSARQSGLAAELWGAPASRQAHLDRLGGIGDQGDHCQTHGQEPTDEMESLDGAAISGRAYRRPER